MNTKYNLPRAITLLMTAAFFGGAASSAQQPPAATPFAKGVQVSVVCTKPTKGGYNDVTRQKIVLTLKFTNVDLKQTYEDFTATISVLGQHAEESKVRKVLLQEDVTLSLPPRKTQEHACEEVRTRFEKKGSDRYGYFYDGWILVVKDAAGKIVLVKSSAPTMEKLTELAAKLKPKGCYSPKLQPVADPEGSDD